MNPTGITDQRERKRQQGLDSAFFSAMCHKQQSGCVHISGQQQLPARVCIGSIKTAITYPVVAVCFFRVYPRA